MADFRKWFPLLAIALLIGSAVTASAQTSPAFTCTSNAGVPPLIRAEGLTELVGDMILNCTGGIATSTANAVPQVNFQIFLNTNVTSKIVSSPGINNWSEALLMIDEPSEAQQNLCVGTCAYYGVNTLGTAASPGLNYNTGTALPFPSGSATSVRNVFQGRQQGANSIVWLGVPVDPPGTTATRVIRMTNVRANAFQLGTSSSLIPTQINMYVSATGTTSVPINNPNQIVAYIQKGLDMVLRSANDQAAATSSSWALPQCASANNSMAADSTADYQKTGAGAYSAFRHNRTGLIKFSELFATAWRLRNIGGAGMALVQDAPGAIYNTETGFYNPSLNSTNGANIAGLADQGTRLMIRFSSIPAGVVPYVSVYEILTPNTTTGSTAGTAWPSLYGSATTASSSRVNLVNTDLSGGGGYSPATATSPADGGMIQVPVVNGTATATWEVRATDPLAVENIYVSYAFTYVSNTTSNLPGLGTITGVGSFAPISAVGTATSTAPHPRFADAGVSRTGNTIYGCATNILFPFVTNQAGFDSGIAISNTSMDPFGTTVQSGTCKINYYGDTTGGGAAPAAQTSGRVDPGKQLLFVLSSGGNLGMAATPGFQGYIIAQCAFQFGHGFAFISDVGSTKVSEAYLGLILDAAVASRTTFTSETLGQ